MSINCEKCGSTNRDTARYCKYCGARLSIHSLGLEVLVGRDNIKNEVHKIITIVQRMKERSQSIDKANLNTILLGNTGTGKNKITEILCSIFFKYGIIVKEDITTVEAVDYPKFAQDFKQNFQKAKGGILFIKDAQKLVPAGYSSELNPLDKLFTEMKKTLYDYDPIVILAGLPTGLKEYFKENPNVKELFGYFFELPDFNAEEMYQIAEKKFTKEAFSIGEDAQKRLKKLFVHIVKTKDKYFSNAHLAFRQVKYIMQNYYLRISKGITDDNIITPEDIKGDIPEEKTLEEIIKEIDSLVGMEDIKREIKDLVSLIEIQKKRAETIGEVYKPNIHMVITGNPGTGKTTVARKLGEIFQSIGLLDRGHVVEVDRKDLVGEYIGSTAPKTNSKINEAMGGILFIDEAYSLAPEGGFDFGKEAIETLLKRMEDDRGKFIVIAAGYADEMERFIKANPGLASRFTKYIDFEDYLPSEMKEIFKFMANSKPIELGKGIEEMLQKIFEDIYNKRDANFANGRTVRNIFEEVLQNQANRIAELIQSKDIDKKILNTITVEDLKFSYKI